MKRLRWSGGEVEIKSWKVVETRWRTRRSRGGTWHRIDSRSSGLEKTRSVASEDCIVAGAKISIVVE